VLSEFVNSSVLRCSVSWSTQEVGRVVKERQY
jgi:hypothetical protein